MPDSTTIRRATSLALLPLSTRLNLLSWPLVAPLSSQLVSDCLHGKRRLTLPGCPRHSSLSSSASSFSACLLPLTDPTSCELSTLELDYYYSGNAMLAATCSVAVASLSPTSLSCLSRAAFFSSSTFKWLLVVRERCVGTSDIVVDLCIGYSNADQWRNGICAPHAGALLSIPTLTCNTSHTRSSPQITYGPDEYIFAALNIYIDIIQIFLFLLRIFGSARN